MLQISQLLCLPRQRNKEAKAKQNRRYYLKHRSRERARSKKYQRENAAKINLKQRERYRKRKADEKRSA